MATTPKPHESHEPTPLPPDEARSDRRRPEPEHVITVQEEQLARSEEMQKVGVEAWMKAHSPPPVPETQQRTVTGVGPLVQDEDEHHGRR
jgi:hypothetical protein